MRLNDLIIFNHISSYSIHSFLGQTDFWALNIPRTRSQESPLSTMRVARDPVGPRMTQKPNGPRLQTLLHVWYLGNVGIAINNEPPISDGEYHPFIVIRGMIYYCFTNITLSRPHYDRAPSMMVKVRDIIPKYMAELFRLVNYCNLPRWIYDISWYIHI